MRSRHEVHPVSPRVAPSHGHLAKVAGLGTDCGGMLVVILPLILREADECKILWPQTLSQLCIRVDPKKRLSAPFNFQIWIVVRIQSVALVIKHVPLQHRRSPVENPPFLRAKPVENSVVDSPNIDPVHESRDRDEARAHILICADVIEMQTASPDFKLVRRPRIVTSVSEVARAERIQAVLASVLQVGCRQAIQVARTRDCLTLHKPVGAEFQARIDAADAVIFAGRWTLPVAVNCANTGLPENIPANPRDAEIRSIS